MTPSESKSKKVTKSKVAVPKVVTVRLKPLVKEVAFLEALRSWKECILKELDKQERFPAEDALMLQAGNLLSLYNKQDAKAEEAKAEIQLPPDTVINPDLVLQVKAKPKSKSKVNK